MARGAVQFQIPDTLLPARGEFGTILGAQRIEVSDLFLTPVPMVEGTTIVVEEKLELVFSIYDEKLVDLDKRFFGQKVFVGNYKYSNLEEFERNAFPVGQSGFIENLSIDIREQTSYFVVGDPNRQKARGGTIVLDPCNLRLAPDPNSTPIVIGSIAQPDYITKGSFQAFKGALQSEIFPTGKGDLRAKIEFIGLFIYPGVELVSGLLTYFVGGQVQTARPSVPELKVCNTQTANCKALTDGFFSQPNVSGPYRTLAEAEAALVNDVGDGTPGSEIRAAINVEEVELAAGCVVTAYGNRLLEG
jgi:hypothetical protein